MRMIITVMKAFRICTLRVLPRSALLCALGGRKALVGASRETFLLGGLRSGGVGGGVGGEAWGGARGVGGGVTGGSSSCLVLSSSSLLRSLCIGK